ncbi:glycosyl hydrolase-related protein [Streptomyces sp. NPDC056231]|uniref:glycosyl hydrolase-related protein n=1 Tax=Streptomyces sp. NPDC056231 TaxID=3345755 RepID=UPI003AAF0D5E
MVNDSTYGHEIIRDVRADGGGITITVRLSLLRAPRFPDPDADQGHHRLHYGFVIGADIADTVREGYAFNQPERSLWSNRSSPRITRPSSSRQSNLPKIVPATSSRLYEAHGGRARTVLTAGFPLASAADTDLLERELDPPENVDAVKADGRRVLLALRPFQILTLRLRPGD